MSFTNAISWFEIPATDLGRATRFYETIFDVQLVPFDTPNLKMRMFPLQDMMTGVGGALVDSGGFHKPSATEGPLIYLNANPDLQLVLDKVENAGGTIIVPKTQISPEYGYMAAFLDTEGNRIALHSIPQP
jgi:uncharacterized protein